jgi:hypothetical protein
MKSVAKKSHHVGDIEEFILSIDIWQSFTGHNLTRNKQHAEHIYAQGQTRQPNVSAVWQPTRQPLTPARMGCDLKVANQILTDLQNLELSRQ